jgi:hypothetical protein
LCPSFNGLEATVNYVSADGKSLIVTVPMAMPGFGPIAVTVNNVTVASSNDFTISQDPYAAVRVKEIDVTDGRKLNTSTMPITNPHRLSGTAPILIPALMFWAIP